jgi:hypothetical protein
VTETHIDDEMKTLIQQQTDQLMVYFDTMDTQRLIPWNAVNAVATALIAESSQKVKYIVQNNNDLYDNSICALIMLAVTIVVLMGYFIMRGVDLRLKFILMENLVIFAFVGMIEIYFFMNIASKYIPVLPDDAVRAVFNRVKYRIAQ